MSFNQSDFDRFVVDAGVIGFFEEPVKLKSGRTSNWYVNWRTASSDAYLLDQLTDHIVAFVRQEFPKVECIYGVPEGATKAAVLAMMKLAKTSAGFRQGSFMVPMGRAKPKTHGDPKDRYFLGMPKGRTVALEDVTTTGGSLLDTVDVLMEANVEVVGAVGLTHRMEKRDDGSTVSQAFETRFGGKVLFRSMAKATQLLPKAVQLYKPPVAVLVSIEEEFQRYGEEDLRLR